MSEVNRYEWTQNGMRIYKSRSGLYVQSSDYDAAQSELAALREENERLKSESFEGLYNEAIRERDALREELANAYNRNAEQRVELDDLHDLKSYATTPLRERCAERKDLQQRLTAAEQRNAEASASMQLATKLLDQTLAALNPTAELSKNIRALLKAQRTKPTESGASEQCAHSHANKIGCPECGEEFKQVESGASE